MIEKQCEICKKESMLIFPHSKVIEGIQVVKEICDSCHVKWVKDEV